MRISPSNLQVQVESLQHLQIIKEVAEYFKVNEKELQNNFLSDQIAYKILDQEADLSILKVAEEKVKYLKTVQNGK